MTTKKVTIKSKPNEQLTMPGTNDGDDDFKNHLKNLSQSTLSWMLWILSGSPGTFRESPRSSTEKKFLEWIDRPRNERPFFLMKKSLLLDIAKSKNQRANMQNTKDEIIKRVLKGIDEEGRQGQQDDTSNGKSTNNDTATTDDELAPLATILHFSFLCPQKQMSEWRAAKIGQRNEKNFLFSSGN